MPIKSYLAHPHDSQKTVLANAVSAIPGCEVVSSENKNLLIIVTDTNNKAEDDALKQQIEGLPSLKLLAMVAGFNTPKNK